VDVHAASDDLLDTLDASIIATDLEGVVTRWNRGAERLFGWTREEAVGRVLCDLIDCGSTAEAVEMLAAGPWQGEMRLRHKDGTPVSVHFSLTLSPGPDGRPAEVVGFAGDLSARLDAERRVRLADEHLRAVMASMAEGLVTLAADGTATYLNRVAEELLGAPAHELLGRPLHDLVHGPICAPEHCRLLGAIASGEQARSEDDAFARADGSLLPVSFTISPLRTGGGTDGLVLVFSDITERREREARLEREAGALAWAARIRSALADERFTLHAQPIVDLCSGQVVQYELLLRMVGEDGALVAPLEFLPTAERVGLVGAIDRWVVRRAAELAADGLPVQINLSGASLSDPAFAGVVERELRAAGADPGRIVVEVTETALVTNEDAAAEFARRITGLGCRMALDDFGTGYGGFSYLKRLPVALLKIDREFVRDAVSEHGSRHVVRAVVDLARGFGQRTVAEGVEDADTLRLLRRLGVDFAQGFAIARPCPVEEVAPAGGAQAA
jgi:PAS domain S-box-containing protein